jgi:hypothetical protein
MQFQPYLPNPGAQELSQILFIRLVGNLDDSGAQCRLQALRRYAPYDQELVEFYWSIQQKPDKLRNSVVKPLLRVRQYALKQQKSPFSAENGLF